MHNRNQCESTPGELTRVVFAFILWSWTLDSLFAACCAVKPGSIIFTVCLPAVLVVAWRTDQLFTIKTILCRCTCDNLFFAYFQVWLTHRWRCFRPSFYCWFWRASMGGAWRNYTAQPWWLFTWRSTCYLACMSLMSLVTSIHLSVYQATETWP